MSGKCLENLTAQVPIIQTLENWTHTLQKWGKKIQSRLGYKKLCLQNFSSILARRRVGHIEWLRDKNLQNSSADFFGVASNWKLNKVWGRGLRSWQGRRADADSGSFQPAGPTLAHFTPDLQHFPRILQQIFCGLRQPSRRGSSYCTSSGGR